MYFKQEEVLQGLARVGLREPASVADHQPSKVKSVHSIRVLHHWTGGMSGSSER